MSGFKRSTVSISSSDLQRLRSDSRKLKALSSLSSVPPLSNAPLNLLQQHSLSADQRSSDFSTLLSSLSSSLADLESSSAASLSSLQSDLFSSLQHASGSLWADTLAALDAQSSSLSSLLAHERSRRIQQARKFSQRLASLELSTSSRFDLASSWLASADNLLAFISSHYPWSQLAPQEFQSLAQQVELARSNLNSSLPEASLSLSQSASLSLSSLRLSLEVSSSTIATLRSSASLLAHQLLDLTSSCSSIPAIDFNGCELPSSFDLDSWSHGDFSVFLNYLSDLVRTLDDPSLFIDEPSLRSLLSSILPEARSDLASLVSNARLALLNSQLRINIADLVVSALKTQGFSLSSSGYSSSDFSSSFSASLAHPDGSQVLVEVLPSSSPLSANELRLSSLDHLPRTAHELKQRTKEISSSLSSFGLSVAPFQVLSSFQSSVVSSQLSSTDSIQSPALSPQLSGTDIQVAPLSLPPSSIP